MTSSVAILRKDPKYELPNNSQLEFWIYAGKFTHRKHDTNYKSFDWFVEMATDLTVIETSPDPKDPNKVTEKVIFLFLASKAWHTRHPYTPPMRDFSCNALFTF